MQMAKTIKKKVVLAFSGGLDTTYCAVYLSKNFDVYAIYVNTGGATKNDILKISSHAKNIGVKSFVSVDVVKNYYSQCVRYLIFGNVLKNNTYPLSVSAERVFQAKAVVDYANKINADAISHGSTGAGNDQIRFDMIFRILAPGKKIIAPIRDLKLSRNDEIEFLKSHRVKMDFQKAKYSINKGLWGTSIGGVETLTSNLPLPESAFPNQLKRNDETKVELEFKRGELIKINGKKFSSVNAILFLQNLCNDYAIGRDMHVGDTVIGIKGRVAFEAGAPMVIIKSHHALEKHTLTKWQLYWKDSLSIWYGNFLHDGNFLDPTMRDIEKFFESTQQNVSGKVFVKLLPYRFIIEGIYSEHDLMSPVFGSYGEMNNAWSGEDAKGFSVIASNQTLIYNKINKKKK